MSKSNDWTVLGMLEWATAYFEQRNIPSPRLSIEWLLADLLKVKRLDLYVQFDRPLPAEVLKSLRELVKRRANHEPLQYITGSTSFYNVEIIVNPSVLIPRPETEELVERILSDYPEGSILNILDIGTGSGCIPVAISFERPEWNIHAVDVSEDALNVAKRNNELNRTTVTFSIGDLFKTETLPDQKWDVIVSNPPYIPVDEKPLIETQVREHEPSLALFCENRSDVYRNIVQYAVSNLKENGRLYLELHEDHQIECEGIFDPDSWKPEILPDLNDKRRFVRAIYQNTPLNLLKQDKLGTN